MQQRSNHVAIGLAFVGICILIAVVAFLAARTAGPPVRSDAANAVIADAENVADQLEAGTYPETPTDAVDPNDAPTAPLPLGLVAGSDYKNARAQLANQGFAPLQQKRQDCSPYGTAAGEECANRPEIFTCSGTGKGYCLGYWTKGDQALRVTTQEGPDGLLAGAELVGRAELEAEVPPSTADNDQPGSADVAPEPGSMADNVSQRSDP